MGDHKRLSTTDTQRAIQTYLQLRLRSQEPRYQTAGGHYILDLGIEPDVEVEIPEEEWETALERAERERMDIEDRQLRRALEVLAEKLGDRTPAAYSDGVAASVPAA